jgi:hypothetical protein
MTVKPVIKTDTMQLITIFNTTFFMNHTHDNNTEIHCLEKLKSKSENELLYLTNTSHVANDMCTKKVYCNQSTHI